MYDFMMVVHKVTGETKIVEEHSDELFDHGFRFKKWLKNSEVNLPEIIAISEEESLAKLAESSSDPCYWNQEKIENGKFNNDNDSDPIYRPKLNIY